VIEDRYEFVSSVSNVHVHHEEDPFGAEEVGKINYLYKYWSSKSRQGDKYTCPKFQDYCQTLEWSIS
jgi:hypothetical protein